MAEALWWQKQLRIIQYNLQSRDCPGMDPQTIARQTAEMRGDSVVINVAGGGVTYFPTSSKFHAVNPWLPQDRDLLQDLLTEFHRRDIKVFGRFEFSLMEESVYHKKPQWVARNPDGSPLLVGAERAGEWGLIYMSCPMGGYQEEGRAIFREAFHRYDIDGVFWMGGLKMPCHCPTCKGLFRERYGAEMPDDLMADEHWPDWMNHCSGVNAAQIYQILREIDPNKPYMRHFWPFDRHAHRDLILPATDVARSATEGNMLVTEAQDILSHGRGNLPEWSTPALRMKVGKSVPDFAPPVGIIHACPGMDWRHACMGRAEFLYWAAQIPANGGSLWTTLTGYPDTVEDKRMLAAVTDLNQMIEKTAPRMQGAKSAAQVLVLNGGGAAIQGWAEILLCGHLPFDILSGSQLTAERLRGYRAVIVPNGFPLNEAAAAALEEYTADGGNLLVEGVSHDILAPIHHLLGAADPIVESDNLESTYLRIEKSAPSLQEKIGSTTYIPLRGKIGFYTPKEDVEVLTTWVPAFGPANVSGLPPERATLPAPHTEVPAAARHPHGSGQILFLSCEMSRMAAQYGLRDMLDLAAGFVELLLGGENTFGYQGPQRVMLSAFQKEDTLLLHLINGVGQRPLQDNIPLHNIALQVKTPGRKVTQVEAVLSGQTLPWKPEGDTLSLTLPTLTVWEMIHITIR